MIIASTIKVLFSSYFADGSRIVFFLKMTNVYFISHETTEEGLRDSVGFCV